MPQPHQDEGRRQEGAMPARHLPEPHRAHHETGKGQPTHDAQDRSRQPRGGNPQERQAAPQAEGRQHRHQEESPRSCQPRAHEPGRDDAPEVPSPADQRLRHPIERFKCSGSHRSPAMAPDAYQELLQRVKRIHALGDASSILQWDQEVMMPSGGTPARSLQLSTLSGLSHDMLVSDETHELITSLDPSDLEPREQANLREVERIHLRARRVPTSLVEEISRTTSEALPAWKTAREESTFSTFAPTLEKLVELKREVAHRIDPDADPYEVLFQDYEPYLPLSTAEEVLATLRKELVPLLDDIRTSDTELPDTLPGTFPDDDQMDLARDVLDLLGYDWDHGRLDTSPHPFSAGNPYDARITTRFDPSAPLHSLLSTVHEFGHATYTQGLPLDAYGTPLGDDRDLTVHESQSRLWENHVGRSHAFMELLAPAFHKRFPHTSDLGPTALYQAANQVHPDNLIRVDADELTYHLHIVLRFEIESQLIRGEMEVDEVPQAWNDRMEEYLGIRPPNDAKGCLQDIHWSHGSFGYFPTYTLGSVLAAQIDAAVREDIPNLDAQVREGTFDPLRNWLREHVHQHGARYTTDELIRHATGRDLTPEPFLEYARSKFGDLYGL